MLTATGCSLHPRSKTVTDPSGHLRSENAIQIVVQRGYTLPGVFPFPRKDSCTVMLLRQRVHMLPQFGDAATTEELDSALVLRRDEVGEVEEIWVDLARPKKSKNRPPDLTLSDGDSVVFFSSKYLIM